MSAPNQYAVRMLPPQDYCSPFVEAYIVSGSGAAIKWTPLWFSGTTAQPAVTTITAYTGGGTATEDRKIEALSYVTSASFEIGEGMVSSLSLTLDPPLEAARALLESDLIKFGQNSLAMRVGYTVGVGTNAKQSSSPLFSAFCTEPDVSYGTNVSITLNGKGSGGYMAAMRVQPSTGAKKKRRAILDEYLTTLRLVWNTDSKNAIDGFITANTYGMQTVFETEEVPVTGHRNSLYLLQDLVGRCNCVMILQDTEVVIYPLPAVVSSDNAPVLNLRFFDFNTFGLSAEHADFPIISANTSAKMMFISPEARTLFAAGNDPVTGLPLKKQSDVPNREGEQAQPGAVDQEVNESAYTTQLNTQTGGSSPVLEAMHTALTGLNGTTGTGVMMDVETIGIPELLPLMQVNVLGVSTALNGRYVVSKVKHNYSSSGFTTSLTLRQLTAPMIDPIIAVPAIASSPASAVNANAAPTSNTSLVGASSATSGVARTTTTQSTPADKAADAEIKEYARSRGASSPDQYMQQASSTSLTSWEALYRLDPTYLKAEVGDLSTAEGRTARLQFMRRYINDPNDISPVYLADVRNREYTGVNANGHDVPTYNYQIGAFRMLDNSAKRQETPKAKEGKEGRRHSAPAKPSANKASRTDARSAQPARTPRK